MRLETARQMRPCLVDQANGNGSHLTEDQIVERIGLILGTQILINDIPVEKEGS